MAAPHDKDNKKEQDEPNEYVSQNEKVKLPVYKSQKSDDAVTIRLTIHPRKLERILYILVIIVLICIIIFKPSFIFSGNCSADTADASVEKGESWFSRLFSGNSEPNDVLAEKIVLNESINVTNTSEEINISVEEEEENETETTTTTPVSTATPEVEEDRPISPTKIALQVVDWEILKKGENWYKTKSVDVQIANSDTVSLYPILKVWYYDDDTDTYFSTERPPLGTQRFDLGIKGGTKRTATFTFEETKSPSFSGNDVHPTILVQMIDSKTDKILKEITKVITIK